MNKIYKVIWSKTRNCYVAVAEFVKRQGKSSSGLNCRHIGAALGNKTAASLLTGQTVAAALLAASVVCGVPGVALANSGGEWDGNKYVGVAPDYAVTIDEYTDCMVYGGRNNTISGASVSVISGATTRGVVYGGYSESGKAEGNTVTISGGTVNNSVIGGKSFSGSAWGNTVSISDGTVNNSLFGGSTERTGSATGNMVYISGGKVDSARGGDSLRGSANDNRVEISGGTVNYVTGGSVGSNGSASGNTVRISGGTVNNSVIGGFVEKGKAENNTVILSKEVGKEAPILNGPLYGGRVFDEGGSVSNNTLQVEAVGLSAPEIQNFENYRFVLPSDIEANDTMLTLKNQGSKLEIDGTKVDMAVAKGSGLNIDFGESITLLHKTGGSGAFSVTNLTGAVQTSKLDGMESGLEVMKYTLENPTDKLNVTVSELYLYGDGGVNTTGLREIGNTLTIKSGKATAAFGGRTENLAVKNSVTMEGGELVVLADEENPNYSISGNLYGGYAGDLIRPGNDTASDNTVVISGGTIGKAVYGGYSKNGNATGNTVEISGGKVGRAVYGGYAENGNATGNTVVFSGGMIAGEVSGMNVGTVYGGYAENGSATGNTVVLGEGLTGRTFDLLNLNGGDSRYYNYFGDNTLQVEGRNIKVRSIANFENYTVILPQSVQAGDTILDSALIFDGDLILDGSRVRVFSSGRLGLNLGESVTVLKVKTGAVAGHGEFILNNADQIPPLTERLDNEATGFVTLAGKIKPVTINELNLTVTEKYLYGDGGTNTKGRREKDNTLTINSGKAMAAFGGRATSGDVTGNKVEMSGGELVQLSDSSDPDYNVSGNLYGGYTDAGNVQGNTVEMSGGKVDSIVVGGFSKAGAAGGDKPEDGNKVIMTGGEAREVMGGYTYDGDAGHNTVSVSNGKVAHVTGGSTLDKGDAVGNTVTLSNTGVDFKVKGGEAYQGRAAENVVTIDGGSVGMDVTGGMGLMAEYNTVNIRDGKINGVLDGLKTALIGGNGFEKAIGNTVTITGGEIFSESVYGGYNNSDSGLAEKNVVTLGGGSYDAGLNVIGGGSDNEAKDNAVNLTGTTQGLDGAKLYGWKETEDGATVTGTGNELHVGGTKTYDKNGSATIAKGSWQGMDANGKHTNRVDTVANFDSIALHNVVWGDVPALSAKNMENIGGLDVTGLEFFTHPNDSTVHEHALSDSMVLLHSDGKALTGLNISYLDEGSVKTEALTNEGINYHTAAHHTEEGGVTVDGIEKKRIYLADHNQSVDFLYHVDGEKITLGDVKFVKGDTARFLDGRFDVRNAEIDADGFNMTDASMKGVEAGEAMTVVDAKDAIKAKGATATLKAFTGEGVTGGVKKYDVAFSDDVTANLNLSGIHTDTLSQNAEKTKLTYTVGEKNVSEATMTGELAWQDGGIHYTNTSYNFNTDAKTDLGGLTFGNVTADPVGQSMTLINGKAAGTVENAPASFGVSLDKANTTLDATAAGTAAVANGDVTYRVTGVTLDKVTVNRVTAAADSVPDTWTVANGATVDTDNMTLPDDMKAGTVRTVLSANSTADFAEATVTGKNTFTVHESFTEVDKGVTVTGDKTGGVKKSDDNKAIVYQAMKDHVSDVTLGDVAFVKDGTARAFTKAYDVLTAKIDAEDLKMTAESMKAVNAWDAMTVLDATKAIANAKGETLPAFADKTYDVAFSDDVTTNLTLSGTHTDTLSQNAEKTKLTYTVGEKNVSEATMTGNIAWQDGATHYTNKDYNFNTDAKTDLGGLTFAPVTTDPSGQSMTLIGSKAAGTVENAPASFGVSLAKANTTLDATAAGTAAVANGDVTYSVTGVTLNKVTVNQVTASADAVPDTWTVAKDATGKAALTIDTENMTLPSGSANKEHAILTVDNDSFAGATVTGQYAYASHSPFTKANGGVSIAGEKEGGVKLSGDNKSVVYHVVQDHVKDVTLGSVTFAKDTTLLPVGNEYEFTKVNAVNVQNFAVNYAAPQNVAANDSMTLLQGNSTLQANALLSNMAADVKTKNYSYSFEPVAGVNVAAKITGSLGTTAKGDGFTYTVNSNQADSLTFGSVDWKDGGILLTRPANITFAGAAVDTSKIHFKNVHGLDADKQMTLVSDFGNKTGKITGSKYYIGTTLEGEGSATLNGNDLVFTTKTGIKPLHAQEQTHNTVMGQTAGISLLSSGAEQISQALNSLSLLDSFGGMTGTGGGTGSTTGTGTTVQTGGEGGSSGQSGSGGSENSGQGQEGSGGSETGNEKGQSKESDDRNGSGNSDQQESNAEANGIIIASVGGGHMHQETGSHVTSNSWNGVLGIGGKRAAKNGTLQYLAFAEHGRANFTLHSDAGRGDGTSKYVGGGLIGKWQNRRDVYVEASIRAGRMHDTANHMLYDDATGRSYGYDVHANYIGGHVGLGKVFYYDNGRNLDVYARYFHMKREGVSFDAGGHFDLDSVTSSVLRVGARYGATDKKWNWYGGLAYEYEFDGKSTGRADGAPIRAASMEGGSVRAEIGLRMEASKTSLWKADINLSGYAGKRRGISGNVAVAYTF